MLICVQPTQSKANQEMGEGGPQNMSSIGVDHLLEGENEHIMVEGGWTWIKDTELESGKPTI